MLFDLNLLYSLKSYWNRIISESPDVFMKDWKIYTEADIGKK